MTIEFLKLYKRHYNITYKSFFAIKDKIMSLMIMSADDILGDVSIKARALRLSAAMTQKELAARAGIALASLRKFERTGQASFELIVRVALALRAEEAFGKLFEPPKFASLDEAMERPMPRQRGRRRPKGDPV